MRVENTDAELKIFEKCATKEEEWFTHELST